MPRPLQGSYSGWTPPSEEDSHPQALSSSRNDNSEGRSNNVASSSSFPARHYDASSLKSSFPSALSYRRSSAELSSPVNQHAGEGRRKEDTLKYSLEATRADKYDDRSSTMQTQQQPIKRGGLHIVSAAAGPTRAVEPSSSSTTNLVTNRLSSPTSVITVSPLPSSSNATTTRTGYRLYVPPSTTTTMSSLATTTTASTVAAPAPARITSTATTTTTTGINVVLPATGRTLTSSLPASSMMIAVGGNSGGGGVSSGLRRVESDRDAVRWLPSSSSSVIVAAAVAQQQQQQHYRTVLPQRLDEAGSGANKLSIGTRERSTYREPISSVSTSAKSSLPQHRNVVASDSVSNSDRPVIRPVGEQRRYLPPFEPVTFPTSSSSLSSTGLMQTSGAAHQPPLERALPQITRMIAPHTTNASKPLSDDARHSTTMIPSKSMRGDAPPASAASLLLAKHHHHQPAPNPPKPIDDYNDSNDRRREEQQSSLSSSSAALRRPMMTSSTVVVPATRAAVQLGAPPRTAMDQLRSHVAGYTAAAAAAVSSSSGAYLGLSPRSTVTEALRRANEPVAVHRLQALVPAYLSTSALRPIVETTTTYDDDDNTTRNRKRPRSPTPPRQRPSAALQTRSGCYLVFDTSSLIRVAELEMVPALDRVARRHRICIPYTTLHELDNMSKQQSKDTGRSMTQLAKQCRLIRDWLSNTMLEDEERARRRQTTSGGGVLNKLLTPLPQLSRRVMVQKRSDIVKEFENCALNNDDVILGYAVYLKTEKEVQTPIIFVTEDKMLTIKASSEQFTTTTVAALLASG